MTSSSSDQRRVRITAGDVTVQATFNGSATADAFWNALPITSRVQTWGDEIYFGIPVHAEEADDAQATVDKGAVAYWPPGHALCLFWGPTPTSQGNEIRPASPVNVIGQIVGDATVLARAADGATISVTRA